MTPPTQWWLDNEAVDRIQAEWSTWLARAEHDPHPESIQRAQRFVLVWAFGSDTEFNFNPEFHARVVMAENMLYRLAQISSPSP